MAAERMKGVGQGRQSTKGNLTPAKLNELIEVSQSEINMSKFAQVVVAEFGGASTLGRELRKAYDDAKPGSVSKTNILKSITAIVQAGAPKTQAGDMSHLSDEDLNRVIQEILERLANRQTEDSDGKEKAAPQGDPGSPSPGVGSEPAPADAGTAADHPTGGPPS